jgi:acylphosphatase
VEAVLEGTPEALVAVTEVCRRGPPGAQVERVEVIEEPAEGLPGFDVR